MSPTKIDRFFNALILCAVATIPALMMVATLQTL